MGIPTYIDPVHGIAHNKIMILDQETVEIVKTAIEKGVLVNLIINNRAGGNAPMIGQEIAEKFVGKKEPEVSQQRGLWDP